ncbi:CoA transferase [Arthrobacter sp. zg-Y1219]|uniref:CoA transferase n=1 Tax=Arthrobacter sp. zg-Y1219 TaxID=3049067 RepID=UPI0024C3A9E3|nr:CoA transferase [Arthrobacter sp. zg-Y1219]MDK1361937.1 CoA transferase [Arthrobacter sp. zg-Y1219]
MGAWIARHSREEVITAFEAADAAVALIYDPSDIVADPQFNALGTIHRIKDADRRHGHAGTAVSDVQG